MSWSSFTSSSDPSSTGPASNREFSRLETAPRRGLPVAMIGLVCTVIFVESFLSTRVDWFADQAAWQWRVKKQLADSGQLNGEVAVVGTSVLFHAIDAAEVNRLTESPLTVTNLALNGMTLHAQTQLLEDLLGHKGELKSADDVGSAPRIEHVLLELRHAVVEKKNWVGGPYFREWARFDQFARSGFVWSEPSLSLSFAANRFLTSFAYCRSIDNFIFDCGRSRGLSETVLARNAEISTQMQHSRGFCPSSDGAGLSTSDVPESRPRPWESNYAGLVWLHRLMKLCESHNIRVTLLQPPAPIFVQDDRSTAGFDADFQSLAAELRRKYPTTVAGIWAPTGFQLSDFSDDHHLSHAGGARLTRDLAAWLDDSRSVADFTGRAPE